MDNGRTFQDKLQVFIQMFRSANQLSGAIYFEEALNTLRTACVMLHDLIQLVHVDAPFPL